MSGGTPTTYWRSGSAQNTVQGITNATGTVTVEYATIDAHGSMGEQEVSADFGPGAVTLVSSSTFGTGITRLTLQAGLTAPGTRQPGQLLTGVVSSFAGRLSGTIVAIGTDGFGNVVLDVRDPFGALQANALGASLRAFNLHDLVAPVLALARVQQGTVGRPQPDTPGPNPQFAVITDAAANFAPLVDGHLGLRVHAGRHVQCHRQSIA